MKKTAAVLLVFALLFCASAFALSGADYPVWDGTSAPADSLYGNIGGQDLLLKLDATAEYSNVADGMAQVCFFAFDKAEQNYLEMYLLLPESATAGDIFSPTSSGMSSVSLYEVSKTGDELYFSGQVSGFAYPSGSSFEMRIESAQKTDSILSMSGTLEGTLVKFKDNNPTEETLSLSGVKFSFTLPLNTSRAPQPSAAPKAPKATMDPHPAFTLPPDYAVL